MAAGNTMTALRERLLAAGHTVFSAPARIGQGPVSEDTGWQGFSEVPRVLPAELTINAVGDIDNAGQALRRFLDLLQAEYAVTEFSVIGHSMGGLFSRAAIGQAYRAGSPLPVRRLITLGSPWSGALLGDHHAGDTPISAANGDPITERIMREFDVFATGNSQGAVEEITARYLSGPTGWNAAQAGALDEVALTLIAGTYFDGFAEPRSVWPHDGLVQRDSALALDVPPAVLPAHTAIEFPNTHSIFVADALGLPWERSLTWDPAVLAVVEQALARL